MLSKQLEKKGYLKIQWFKSNKGITTAYMCPNANIQQL